MLGISQAPRKSKNRSIKGKESDRLWAASAGRCNICGTSLIRDEKTGAKVNLGEKAHIVGITDGPRSPRGTFKLPLAKRNQAENLILLCANHHRVIDKEPEKWPVERLRVRKRDFEQRIFFLTNMTEDDETLVLRMLGSIHGSKVPDLGQVEARELVLEWDRRYPRFELSSAEHDIEVNLRELDEGAAGYWGQVLSAICSKTRQIHDLRNRGKAAHVSVFGLARIPALVALGACLGDGSNTKVFHRRNQDGWGWDSEAPVPVFETAEVEEGDPAQDVTLLCSVTANVRTDRLPSEIRGGTVFELRPVNLPASPHLMDHPDSLSAFGNAYRQFLAQLEKTHPYAKQLNLAAAVPADVAVVLGQIQTPAITPTLRIFDLDVASSKYVFACEASREIAGD